MRYARDHKAKTRDRVVREAARELRAHGRDNVSVARIMKRAGLTHGGFYAHFASKQALVAEAIGATFHDARRRLTALSGDDPRGSLRDYVAFYLSRAHRDNRERGCPLPALVSDLPRGGIDARERFGTGVGALSDRLAQQLRALGHTDPERAGIAMLTQMVGALALSRAVADPAQSDAILAAARCDVMARYHLADDAQVTEKDVK